MITPTKLAVFLSVWGVGTTAGMTWTHFCLPDWSGYVLLNSLVAFFTFWYYVGVDLIDRDGQGQGPEL